MNCSACSHYHCSIDQLMCDKGLYEVRIFGVVKVSAEMPMCIEYDESNILTSTGKAVAHIQEQVEKEEEHTIRLDKRTKAYREANK